MSKAQFLGNIILKGKLECLTGMHIGGSKERFEIGGVDSPVIRDPMTRQPFIPGSSLKGKMRSLLAFSLGYAASDPPSRAKDIKNKSDINEVLRVFGLPGDVDERLGIGPTRLIVRDSYPDNFTQKMWESMDFDLLYTEVKPENSINRITSAANPRFIERVVKGSQFNVEFVFGVYRVDEFNDEDYFKYFIEALRLLEHSTLGGSGSRGYGQVSFKFIDEFIVLNDDYRKGSKLFKDSCKPLDRLIDDFKYECSKRVSDFDDSYIIENIISKFKSI